MNMTSFMERIMVTRLAGAHKSGVLSFISDHRAKRLNLGTESLREARLF
jgi:hypothetical protein